MSGKDFSAFFAKYVDGTEAIDWHKYLNYAGLKLEETKDKTSPGVYLGIRTRGDQKETKISNITPDSPAAIAGLAGLLH